MTARDRNHEAIMGTADAARIGKVSPRRVLQRIKRGELPAQRIGKNWILNRRDVEADAARRRAA